MTGRQSRPLPKVFTGVLRTAILAVAAVSLGACVAPFPPELLAERRSDVADVMADAYEEVTENYIERVEVDDLAVAGLANLSQLEPALSLQADTETVSLSLREEEVYRFARPPADDVDAWAEAAADTLIAARARSGGLRAISGTKVFENQMQGIAGALGRGGHYSNGEGLRDLLFPKYDSSIAFTYRLQEQGMEVWRLDPGGRLEAEGLRKGDILTHVNFAQVKGANLLEVRKWLAGQEGSTVALTVLRGEPPSEVNLRVTRWKTKAPTFQLVRRGGIAIFRFPYLNIRATEELTYRLGVELSNSRRGGQPLTGLILDLRDNIGGFEWASTDLANSFLGRGNISTQRGYQEKPKRVINASWPESSDNLPLVVLVDAITGYGAEDVAAALQDNQRAIVIGSSTLGDGVVRKNVSLYNMGSIFMPVAWAYAPAGYGIAGRGVMPNVCTSHPDTTLYGILAALRRGEGLIDVAVRTRKIDPDDAAALAEHRALCPPVSDSGDLAQQVGMAILKDPALYTRLVKQGTAGS